MDRDRPFLEEKQIAICEDIELRIKLGEQSIRVAL